MGRKGYTAPLSQEVRDARNRRRTARRLRDMLVCFEHYLDNRSSYTADELNTLQNVVENLRGEVYAVRY